MDKMKNDAIKKQIVKGFEKAGKAYIFNDDHDETKPAQMWFQESDEGRILFIVFYSQACRWSRCLGCNLPSQVASRHISYKAIMAQTDHVFSDPEVAKQANSIRKIIVSNNGSILDEATFSSTALMYLIAKINLTIPNLTTLCIETRPEYVDLAELEFIARALDESDNHTHLEIAIGFEAFDNHIRNEIFDKGLPLDIFERFVEKVAPYKYRLKCYFMQKPVPGMTDKAAVSDIHQAIDYLSGISKKYNIKINMHLNPTYVASGTILEESFRKGEFKPPRLEDVIKATKHIKNKSISIFVGLSDEGLAVEGGSFIRNGDEELIEKLEMFNQTQDFNVLD